MSVAYKEISEILTALEVSGTALKEAFADGQVDWKDSLILAGLLNKVSVFMDASNGVQAITLGSLMQLEQNEIASIVIRIQTLVAFAMGVGAAVPPAPEL